MRKNSISLPSVFLSCAMFITALSSSSIFAAEPPLGEDFLLIAADPWCPFNCVPGSAKEGVMVDLTREAMRAKGIKVKYVTRPWKRAINEAKAGILDGVIAAGVSDGKGLVLHSTPYAMSKQGVAVLKEDDFEWVDAFSIGNRRLVKILGYGYGGVLNNFIASVKDKDQIIDNTGENVLSRNLEMIVKRRADITIDEINVLKLTAADAEVHHLFRFLTTGIENKLFIGLSPAIERSSTIAKWLDEEMVKMVEDGRYQEILRKYDMEAWLN